MYMHSAFSKVFCLVKQEKMKAEGGGMGDMGMDMPDDDAMMGGMGGMGMDGFEDEF